MPDLISRAEGRHLFGLDPEGYDDVRPQYPDLIYQFMIERSALGPNLATLEIGAGSGLATRRLIDYGADPITVVEPDVRFAPQLQSLAAITKARLHLVQSAFEDAALPPRCFDLVAAATSFHWLDPTVALDKIAHVLKPGGYAALWWNLFGDLDRADPFHDATTALLADLAVSPSGAPNAIPFALDRAAREAQFVACGKFAAVEYAQTHWTLTLNTPQVGRLYGGFSHIQRLPATQRTELLEQLMALAQNQFGGTIERNMTSVIYLARRKEP
jgi:SAM-dependent methyltransferase